MSQVIKMYHTVINEYVQSEGYIVRKSLSSIIRTKELLLSLMSQRFRAKSRIRLFPADIHGME